MPEWAKKHPYLVTLLAFSTLATVLFVASLLIPLVCKLCEYNEYTKRPDCAYHHLGPFALFWIIEVIDKHNGFVTAVATLVMAAFTGTLWWTTSSTIQLARDEFAASHRPKIFVHSVKYVPSWTGGGPNDGTETVGAQIIYFNKGRSDAIIRSVMWGIQIRKLPLESDITLAHHPPKNARITSGKGDYASLTSDLTLSEIRQLSHVTGTGPVLIGKIIYEDLRGLMRQTGFVRILASRANGDVRWVKMDEPEYEFSY